MFIGVGQDVDVQDYLHGAAFTRVDELSVPWRTVTSEIDGVTVPAVDPDDLDWWLVKNAGTGSASITLPLPDETIDVVVMDPDRSPGFTPEITVTVEQSGVFAFGLAVAIGGLGLALAGWVWGSSPRPLRADDNPVGAP